MPYAVPGLTTNLIRVLVTLGFLVPVLLWLAVTYREHLRGLTGEAPAAQEEPEEERVHGRDYHLGTAVGRTLKADDVVTLVRRLRHEDIPLQLTEDDGGEKVFTARGLPPTRTGCHELEAGLLAGALHATLQLRFDVEEERCSERGDAYCRFVAVKG